MGTTHIFRGDEFISSTPKFLSVYDALEITPPHFVSLSPILGAEGTKKLGKRDGAKDILDYKTEGYLPEAMMNYLAFIGWNPGTEQEVFSKEEFIAAFTIEGIQKAGGKANDEKLKWFNKEHLNKLSDEEFAKLAAPFVSEKTRGLDVFASMFAKIVPVLRDRISYLAEVADAEAAGELAYYFEAPEYDADMLLCPEKQRKGKDISLTGLVPIFEHLKKTVDGMRGEGLTAEYAKEVMWPYAEIEGRGVVLWALRYALSGKERSPDPFTLLSILGKDETKKRIDIALERIGKKS
jgi:glutamyl/glutaminyl-tRNA synthetase